MSSSAPAAIVVDCSLLADLLLAPSSVGAGLSDVAVWHAPSLVEFELISVLRGHLLSRQLAPEQAISVLDDFRQLGVHLWPVDTVVGGRILQLAHNFSAYDAAYVALAEALQVPLATRDRRLATAAAHLVAALPL